MSGDEAPEGVIQVPAERISLEAYCAVHGVQPVHFIKLDVEGHELEALRGAEALLHTDRPALLFESFTGATDLDERTLEIFTFLRELGYRGFGFDERQRARRPLQVGVVESWWCHNFAFVA